MCVPQLQITARQFGWSGETDEGFLHRMRNDCAFTADRRHVVLGMNDFRYRAYTDDIGNWYRNNYSAVVNGLQSISTHVVLGSAGCVGKVPHWVQNTNEPVEDLNLSLCHLHNIGIGIAAQKQTRFADVFWPMLVAGSDYALRIVSSCTRLWQFQML